MCYSTTADLACDLLSKVGIPFLRAVLYVTILRLGQVMIFPRSAYCGTLIALKIAPASHQSYNVLLYTEPKGVSSKMNENYDRSKQHFPSEIKMKTVEDTHIFFVSSFETKDEIKRDVKETVIRGKTFERLKSS